MPFPYYRQKTETRLAEVPEDLTLPRLESQDDPSKYLPDPGLVDAVNVALLLGQPLLLTGEPGTGKTQLAYSVSWQLGFEKPSPLIFETKSTSTARDLFYTYDMVGRFHAAQTGRGLQDNRAYITYNALGAAILLANEEKRVKHLFPVKRKRRVESAEDATDATDDAAPRPDDPGAGDSGGDVSKAEEQLEYSFRHGGRRRSVVLIDEIDKAPRDFPNDILNEVESMYFRVPELDNEKVDIKEERGERNEKSEQWRPVVILTSNSEKNLPDAFLRRCVYYHIPFPKQEEMRKIVAGRMGYVPGTMDDALDLFYRLHAPNSLLVKKPATAELLRWLTAIQVFCKHHGLSEDKVSLKKQVDNLIKPTLGVLVKNESDWNPALAIVKEWSDG